MKSFIGIVLFVICVQFVCYDCHETLLDFYNHAFDSSPTRKEIFRIFNKCDMYHIQNIVIRIPRDFCTNQNSNTEKETKLMEMKNILKHCVDSSYFHDIDSIHKVAQNVLKIFCDSSVEYFNAFSVLIINYIDAHRIFNHLDFQASSCVFSEKEVMKVSKTVDTALDFYSNLIQGHELQCGVVQRIKKCTLKNVLKGTDKLYVERLADFVDLFLKSFECKIDADIDVSFQLRFKTKVLT